MLAQKGGVAGAAPHDNQHDKSYRSSEVQSSRSLKQQIGTLLYCLQFPVGSELSHTGWGLLERLLRRYVAAKDRLKRNVNWL